MSDAGSESEPEPDPEPPRPLDDHLQDSKLIADLRKLAKTSPKIIRSTVYLAPSDPSVALESWKMNEYKYYDVPSPFPTLARGLFSRQCEGDGGDQIVARGYDKFFNIGEVPWTDWSSLEAHTGPTYTLSVKSNGCIIFVAAISPSKLIVTSKHAIGEMEDTLESHSQAGHRWLKVHLASRERTEVQLAAALWEKNWTAVAELCDDSFEEHVLPYPPEKSGLYLHGINENRKEFHTLPTRVVDAFAQEWGFLKTTTIVYDTLSQVKNFTDEIAKTGKWKGEPLEGFVVRTHIADPKPGSTSRPPYLTGSSFFFKVKFDEPYMMYRDWRELTKSLLSTKGSLNDARLPKSKMKRPETRMYLKWIKNEIRTNRSTFEGYTQGKGVLVTRERFLEWLVTEQGKTPELEDSGKSAKEFGKTIIVPIAIPGCGKTAVSVALTHLFESFAHTQSDDVQGKKSANVFIKNVTTLLEQHDVVIADKNNHLRQHREALRDVADEFHPPARLLALNWSLDLPRATILRVCGDRILDRGDRHQSLRPDLVAKSHESVVQQFLHRTEELAEGEVDASVEMDIEQSLEVAVARAVDGCVDILGLERPSQERIDEAVAVARAYTPATKKGVLAVAAAPAMAATQKSEKKKSKSPTPPRYFAILAELDCEAIVGPLIERTAEANGGGLSGPSSLDDGRTFWRRLVDERRVTTRPHVTVVHMANLSLPEEADLWERCTALDKLSMPPLFSFKLRHLLWNDRVMALTVEDLAVAEDDATRNGDGDRDRDVGQEKHTFVSTLPAAVRESLHITLGTAHAKVSAYEARELVDVWRAGKQSGIGSLELVGLSARGRIRGLT